MRVIVEHYGRDDCYAFHDVDEKQLAHLKEQAKYIEMDFEMQLINGKQLPSLPLFKKQSMLFATIGEKQLEDRVDAFYDMETQALYIKNAKRSLKEAYWISCYMTKEYATASSYIATIMKLTEFAKACEKPLVIYSELIAKEPYYRYRSLTSKIINQLLEKVNGVVVMPKARNEIALYYTPSHNAFEFYVDKCIYLSCTYEEMIGRIVACLDEGPQCDFRQVYRTKSVSQSLYTDLFYERIPKTEKIYVPLRRNVSNEIVQHLQIKVVQLSNGMQLIYDTKQNIDANAQALKAYVAPYYELPILARSKLQRSSLQNLNENSPRTAGQMPYKGRGVYIALVSSTGVDYRLEALRNADGTTRIAGIWEQIEGDKGIFYTQEQINKALQSEKPEDSIPIDDTSDENNMLLTIVGGKSSAYEGIASEAEFLIAKIKPATEHLQTLYSGMPQEESVTMGDMLIGLQQLQEVIESKAKPVVFYIPYEANLVHHDGEGFYQECLEDFSKMKHTALIVPTGEEGNKQHHCILEGKGDESPCVQLHVSKPQAHLVGLMTASYLAPWQVILTNSEGKSVEISQSGVYTLGDSKIYSQGEQLNGDSGIRSMMFQIEAVQEGIWQVSVKQEKIQNNQVDLWISGQAANAAVTLRPAHIWRTNNALGSAANVICVGAYDLKSTTTLGSSGRGCENSGVIKPDFSTAASIVTLDAKGEKLNVQGTVVSGSIIVGAAATLFEKWQAEKEVPCLNGPILKSMLQESCTTYAEGKYPNANQGYGIFVQDTLDKMLRTPFNA